MDNKRGQGLSVTTIIVIILALVVLVFLIYGFSVGWGNFFERIINLGGGPVNVDAIVSACQLNCNSNQVFEFCNRNRTVNFGKGHGIDGVPEDGKVSLTCNNLKDQKYKTGLDCDIACA